ncbi:MULTISPECIES: hypothetical protein [unclassified Ensifer]|uniref:hypothetical protein n=1 Tax=unclassified Ensifer TaxID=2633371 RepID=UPI00070FE03E|nr:MULTISPECIES: hypothetical protein [unclassified Ensifer]KQW61982.1 hypothetical protein ASD02_21055 [Ensifer sp. Root1252]KRC83135.1 hypothetical protein ASE32_24100 [Ensifer sp. Root231]KRC85008.1 hypothetical protein ASE47_18260 [Ensifer sp. Root258]
MDVRHAPFCHGRGLAEALAPLDYTRWFRQVPKVGGAGILYVAYRANQLPLTATIETWGARDRALPTPGFIAELD